jgi:hypothetical protein
MDEGFECEEISDSEDESIDIHKFLKKNAPKTESTCQCTPRKTHNYKRECRRFPLKVTDILRSWFKDHMNNTHPTRLEREVLMSKTGLTSNQISSWLANVRKRQRPSRRPLELMSVPPAPNIRPMIVEPCPTLAPFLGNNTQPLLFQLPTYQYETSSWV